MKRCSGCGKLNDNYRAKLKLSKPVISGIQSINGGVKITYGKITGAQGYEIYRKTGTGSYKLIGITTSLSYTDRAVSSGTTYTYSVNAYVENEKSGYKVSGKNIKYLAMPTISSATNTSSGITIKWSKVTGASGYYLYRKTSGTSWTRIATITSGSTVSYTDTKAVNGTTYTYTVKAYSGSYTSSYNATGKTMVRLGTHTISSVTNSTVKIVTVSGNTNMSKVIGSLTKGKTYTVYVRGYKKVGSTTYYSAWSAAKTVKITK